MATYLVSNSGNGTDGTLAGGWANAHQTLQAAATVATTDGDFIWVDHSHQETATTLAVVFTASVSVICVDKDNSDVLSTMVAGSGFIKVNSTGNLVLQTGDGKTLFFDGISFIHSGTGARILGFYPPTAAYDNAYFLHKCYLGIENVGHTGVVQFGSADKTTYAQLTNCKITLADVGNRIRIGGIVDIIDTEFTAYSTEIPTALFNLQSADSPGVSATLNGCDLSAYTDLAIVDDTSLVQTADITLSQCKLPTGYSLYNRVSATSLAGAKVYVFDCSTGDTHGVFGYGDALGSAVTDAGIYVTAGDAGQSWKIVTTANASKISPFLTPWIDIYHSGTSSVVPYFEVLRDGSATAYKHDEAWGEFLAKVTSGTTKTSLKTNRCPSRGTAADLATGSGTSAWTGEGGTAWSGKSYTGSGTSLTPAEAGYIRGRLGFAVPSATLYLDPQIRGLA